MQAVFDRTLINELNKMMQELYDLVSKLQTPKPGKDGWRQAIRQRCEVLVVQISEILATIQQRVDQYEDRISERLHNLRYDWHKWIEQRDSLHTTLEGISEKLKIYSEELGKTSRAQRFKSMYKTLSAGYEDLVDEIRVLKRAGIISSVRARHLKPINYKRNLFHAINGITGVLLYGFVLSRFAALTIMITLLSIAVVFEITRKIWPKWNDFLVDYVFRLVVRPHERTQINSLTWFVVALVAIVYLFPKNVALASVLVLSLADPAASIAGKLWGNKKIVGNKTYIGSMAFMIVAFVVALSFMLYAHTIFYSLFAALLVAMVGTLVELFITRIDDNFTIPIACSIMFFLLL